MNYSLLGNYNFFFFWGIDRELEFWFHTNFSCQSYYYYYYFKSQYMHTPKIRLTSSTYTWVYNLFILQVLDFLLWVVLYSEIQLHTLLFCKTFYFPSQNCSLFSLCSLQNCQPPLLTLFSYLQLEISGGVMINS